MKIVEEQQVTVPALVDVLCDRCQQSTKTEQVCEFATLAADWQTPPEPWGTRGFWEIHLCQACWFEILPQLVSPERLAEAQNQT